MAHHIAQTTTGKDAFISHRLPAWHRLGTVVSDKTITPEMVFSQDGGGLGYNVEKIPAMYRLSSGELVTLPDQFFRVRNDTGAVFGPSCTDAYTVQQNVETMSPILTALVDAGLAQIETAGVLRGGADSWVAVRFKGASFDEAGADDAGDDRTEYYGILMNNFDGRAKFRILFSPIRVVCANTQGFALRDPRTAIVGVRHTKNGTEKVQTEAMALWVKASAYAAEFHAVQEQLKRQHLTKAQFDAIVLNTISPLLDVNETGLTARAKKVRETRNETIQTQRDVLTSAWFTGTGSSARQTAWDAYNAVTESLDHNTLFQTQHSGSEFMETLLPGGKLNDMKHEVMLELLAVDA